MLAFPSMIAEAATKAGIKVPEDPDSDFNRAEFPHFIVFCTVQLARPIQWGEHWDNAKVVAQFSDDEIKKATLEDLLARGLRFQQ